MKIRFTTLALILAVGFNVSAKQEKLPIYKDTKAPVEKRIKDLLKRMTLEEKIYQLAQGVCGDNDNANNIGHIPNLSPLMGSVIYTGVHADAYNVLQRQCIEESRLGIPILTGYDVIHGFRNIYPIPLASACSFNPASVEECCAIAAREARLTGVFWTFSPMIDVAHDPRWGRIAEGYGEDPYTQAVLTAAAVRGYQGDTLSSPYHVAACLKHYVGYGASEAGRDYVYTEISRQSLWDTYLPPYKAGVEAGAATLMSAFNNISGVPASGNHYTLTEVLKEKWGHDGFVVSDWDAVLQLQNQGVAADGKEAALIALTSGVEMDMSDGLYVKYLKELVDEKKLDVSVIDEAVRRVLRVKFRLGLFENPYIDTNSPEYATRFMRPQDTEAIERAAEETVVLLKNEGGILPLQAQGKKIAVIGPLAKAQGELLGCWAAHRRVEDVRMTLFDALSEELAGKAEVRWAQGSFYDGADDEALFSEAVELARQSDVVVLCLGEKETWTGESRSRSTILLPSVQHHLLQAISKTGKPIVLTLNNGRPLELSGMEPMCQAIVELWQSGVPGGIPGARVLSGRVNPSGKLAVTFPYTSGQIPIYYNRRNPARNPKMGFYQDVTVEPMYTFGHGLSYSTFKYGDLKLSSTMLHRGETFTASIDVTNTSKLDGKETVMLYVKDPACSIARPMKELRAFDKKMIPAGQTVTFTFELTPEHDLSFVDSDGDPLLENGTYFIEIGNQRVEAELQ